MRFFILFILLFLSFYVFSQDAKKIDSLRNLLTKPSLNDSIRIDIYDNLTNHYLKLGSDSALFFANELNSFSIEKNNNKGLLLVYCLKANHFNIHSEFDSAIYYGEKGLELAKVLDNLKLQFDPLHLLIWSYYSLGNFAEARIITMRSLEIANQLDDWDLLYRAYFGLGNLYFYESDYDQAIASYIKVDSIIVVHNIAENSLLGSTLVNIAAIFITIKEYNKAEPYITRALKLYERLNLMQGWNYANLLQGMLDVTTDRLSEGLDKLLIAEEYFKSFDSPYDLSETYYFLGETYLKLHEIEKAEKYYRAALALMLSNGDKMGEANCYHGLGNVFFAKKNFRTALKYYNMSLTIYDDLGDPNIIEQKTEVAQQVSKVYAALRDYEKAYENSILFHQLNKELLAKQNKRNLLDLETKYQSEKKEQEIELLTSQNQLAEQQRRNQLYVFSGFASFILMVAILFYFLYRNRQKIASKLKEMDTIKSNLFANISHEFRTPLTLIKSPVEDQLSNEQLTNKERNNLEIIDHNANRLLSLVDQLLDLSKLEAGSTKLNVEEDFISAFLKALVPSFVYAAKQKNIDFENDIDFESDKNWFDKDILEKIVVNLLSNAIKYTPEKGQIQLKVSLTQGKVLIRVKNTGEGINKEEMYKVFDRFYQSNNTNEGVGIGLALVKELVLLHKGIITFESEVGATEFEVELPVSKHFFNSGERKQLKEKKKTVETPVELNETYTDIEEERVLDEKPILLIVEDNADVRAMVKNLFEETYTVLEAKDGAEGIEKAIHHIPDILISDVMMPVKDGIELCKTLKTDERTSHIPIILLTAKAGEENEMEGLETGADDYITKPFNSSLLKVRVQKLVELRAQLRVRYSQEVVLKPKDIAISSADEKFLERVQHLFDNQLTDSLFTAEKFSVKIGMSRMQLHRKIKALIGLTTSEFIRSQRLKTCVALLGTDGVNISEVGYKAGFNDPSYFAKCFKEAYGCTPTEFTEGNKL